MKRFSSLQSVREAMGRGEVNLPGLVDYYLGRIHSQAHLGAFLESWDEEARQRAVEVQARWERGEAGRLAGMVLGLKDNICYRGHNVSAASAILGGFESLFDSTAVKRLLEEDAILIGRCNCDEFAMGSSNENSAYGPVGNPLDPSRVPGGSSGGSAAAVAADMCLAALGSDTGGSVRQPASLTGTIGLKPSYGRISRHGLIAYASSFDQIGPMTASVSDAALLLEVMAGPDEYDSTASANAVEAYSSSLERRGTHRIAYLRECLDSPGLSPEVRTRMEEVIEGLRAKGHVVEPVSFPYLDYIVPAYYVLTTAEASSNLARFDGIHYGYRSPRAAGIEATYRSSRSEGFGEEVKRRIMLGTFVLSSGYYDAYYTRAQRVRALIRKATLAILGDYDFILTPTTTGVAFRRGDHAKDPIAMYLEDIFTVQANLVGIPAISLPLGSSPEGLPFGIQVMGRMFGEAEMLAFSDFLVENFSSGGIGR